MSWILPPPRREYETDHMADVFISYSTADEDKAKGIYDLFVGEQLSVFMASISLEPGSEWSKEIRRNLDASDCLVFLASHASRNSPFAQQEIGMAHNAGKHIVPIMLDIDPSQLPGWTSELQATDFRSTSPEQAKQKIAAIAAIIRWNKTKVWIALGILAVGIFALSKG